MDLTFYQVFLTADDPRGTKELHTIRERTRTLKRLIRDQKFDIPRFFQNPEEAIREGKRVLMLLRGDSPNPWNHAQRVLNDLARYCGWQEVHFRKLREPKPLPKTYTLPQLQAILSYTSQAPGWRGEEETRRRRALAWCSHFMAARRGEIHRLRVPHFDTKHLFYTIERPSKRGPPRSIPVEAEFYSPRRPLATWLRNRPLSKSDPTAIWTARWARGDVRVLSYEEIGSEMHEMSLALGFPVNFNRGRHTRATWMLRSGVKLPYIQRILGHARIQTTAIYAEANMDDVARDFRKHRPPSPYTKEDDDDEEPET